MGSPCTTAAAASADGRPPKEHRATVEALFWLGKTGAPWRDLPERFGPWRTVATRFYRWTQSGLWERIVAEQARHLSCGSWSLKIAPVGRKPDDGQSAILLTEENGGPPGEV